MTEFPKGTKAGADAIINVPCDYLDSRGSARCDKDNANRPNAKIAAEGVKHSIYDRSGGPRRVGPADFVVNAGGVVCAAAEFHGGNETTAFMSIDEKIRRNTALLIDKSRCAGISMREAAVGLATERVWNA